jgi:RNA polymerase primary sigma factor
MRGALAPLTEDRELDADHIETLIHDLRELEGAEYAVARDDREVDADSYHDSHDAEVEEEERRPSREESRKAAAERYEHFGHDLADVWTMKSGKAPLLTAAQEIVLAKRAERGDPQAKEELLNANVRLVASVARRYLGRGLPLEDLMQEGMIGLMRAIEKYNYRKGYRFSTYATHWIRQAVSRALANQGRSIRLPAHVVDAIGRIARIREELFHKLGRPPTRVEVADAAGITEKKLVQLIRSAVHPVSLDAPVGEEGESRLGDFVHAGDESSPSDRVFQSLVHEELEHALNAHLTPREKDVLALRYGLGEEEPHTLEETGRRLHITRERARQIESKALEKLRHIQVTARLQEAVT